MNGIVVMLTSTVVILSVLSDTFLGVKLLTPTYILKILSGIAAITLNTYLYATNPENAGLLLFHFISCWQILMSIFGLVGGEKTEDRGNCNC